MVAQSTYYLPKAGEEAARRNGVCRNPENLPISQPKEVAVADGDEGETEEEVSGKENHLGGEKRITGKFETNKLQNKEAETRHLEESDIDEQDDRLVMADTGEEEPSDAGQEIDDASSGNSGDESQDGKAYRNPGWRKKSHQKMEHGKNWIKDNLFFVATGGFTVPLSLIERKYLENCQRKGQEPLSMFVLARLLHQEFPDAGKCRLGPRRNQKIHYTKLKWVVRDSPQQYNSAATPLTPAVDERAEKTPIEGSLSPLIQGDSKDPRPDTSGRVIEKKQQKISDATSTSPNQSALQDEDEGAKECVEAAARMEQVVKKVSSQGKRDLLLKSFAHSASCHTAQCTSLCLMFRRVRRHVVSARHKCHVMRIYSALLQMHVAFCVSFDCGLPACPALRASQQNKLSVDNNQKEEQQKKWCVHEPVIKRSLEDEKEEQLKEPCVQEPLTKKPNVHRQPSPIVLMRQTSLAPMPDSPPSTPTPLPLSPQTISTPTINTPISYVIYPIPPMPILKPSGCSFQERVGA